MTIVVYSYGCPSWVEWPEEAQRQLHLAHEMRNDLVEIERNHDAARKAIWASDAHTAPAQQEADETGAAVTELRAQLGRARRGDGSQTRAEVEEELAKARRRYGEAKQRFDRARDEAYPRLKSQIIEADQARQAAVKALYGEYVQRRRLYWATHHDVVDHYKALRKQIREQRRQGVRAQMRFQPWTGEGSLMVQLQRDNRKNQPRRSPELLASGEGPWRFQVQLAPWVDPQEWEAMPRAQRRRTARTGELVMRLDSDGGQLRLPVVVHRMLPWDADIPVVRVTRRRVGAQMRTEVHVTAHVPNPPARTDGPAVGVHLGWRALPNGTLRAAVIRSSEALPPPRRGCRSCPPGRAGRCACPWGGATSSAASGRCKASATQPGRPSGPTWWPGWTATPRLRRAWMRPRSATGPPRRASPRWPPPGATTRPPTARRSPPDWRPGGARTSTCGSGTPTSVTS